MGQLSAVCFDDDFRLGRYNIEVLDHTAYPCPALTWPEKPGVLCKAYLSLSFNSPNFSSFFFLWLVL